jgi:hypothetical protein
LEHQKVFQMRSSSVPGRSTPKDQAEVAAWLCRAIAEAENLHQTKLPAALASTTLEGWPTVLPMAAINAGLAAADADAAFAWLWRAGPVSRSSYDGSRHVSVERRAGR